jgi:hypothetical protein
LIRDSLLWPDVNANRAGSASTINWETEPLTLDQLGAIVRVGRVNPGDVEQVAPVALYHSKDRPRVICGACDLMQITVLIIVFVMRDGVAMFCYDGGTLWQAEGESKAGSR